MLALYESWSDIRYIPLCACGASLILLLFSAIARLPAVKAKLFSSGTHLPEPIPQNAELSTDQPKASLVLKARSHVYSRGGPVVYAFHVLRLLGCTALVALSLASVILHQTEEQTSALTPEAWPRIAIILAYIYATIMSFLAFVPKFNYRRTCDAHATFLLLVLFVAFAWRNFYPLTMYGGVPADASITWLLWSTGVLTTIVAVVIPVVMPRVYYPLNPADPASAPSPEQTASVLAFVTYTFLDPLVFTAWRLPRLPYEELPPLPDTDWAKNLAAVSLDRLDPLRRRQQGLKERHIFFGFLQIFGLEYFAVALTIMAVGLIRFLGPISVNHLLLYLETGGEGAVYRPWIWILFLFCGTAFKSIIMNLYFYITSHVIVQVESIIIQLVFERSMKIRTVNSSSGGQRTGGTTTPAVDIHDVDLDDDTLAGSNGGTTNGSSPVTDSSSISSSTAISKAKQKQTAQQKAVTAGPSQDGDAKTSEISGRVNTIIGTDLPNIVTGRDWLYAIEIPMGIVLAVIYLYQMLSYAAFVGMAVTVLSLPIPGTVAQLVSTVQQERMKKTEIRVQSVSEAMGMLRMAKMFAWESKVNDDIAEKRDTELLWVRKKKLLDLVNINFVNILPLLTMSVTFAFYTLVMGKDLDASRVFPSIVVFELLRYDLMGAFMWLSTVIQAGVSLGRVDDFLRNTELLDEYAPAETDLSVPVNDDIIGFNQATFTWMGESNGAQTPGRRNFRLHVDELIFKSDAINLIVGPTGCGKTSILLALLGEMHFQPASPSSWFSLPRSRGVSYAAQEPWVQNETIKKNILFDEPYDEERYKKVLYQCALEPDLALFEAGDETEVGEKGLTLSGGQKARVTLARAIYSRARIVLLDDVLSALDVHTSRWIVDHCFRGDLIKSRTILLVTHNVAIAAPVAQNVVSLDLDGRIASQGTIAEVLSKDSLFRMELKETTDGVKSAKVSEILEAKPEAKKADGKLVLAEEIAEGRLSWHAARLFLDGFGGPYFWIICLSGYVLVHIGDTTGAWWLGVWASAYEGVSKTVNVPFYLSVYATIMCARFVVYALTYTMYILGSLESCRKIHQRLCQSVLRSTLRWLDTTPTGRIISRFTQDIREIDDTLPTELDDLIMWTVSMTLKLTAIVIISPVFAGPGILLLVAGYIVGQIYISAQLAVKRERSNWRSPLYNHFSAAAAGVASIRAFGAEKSFRDELLLRLDGYSRPSRTFYNLNRWISMRTDIMGGLFTASLAAYLLYFNKGVGASNTGFSLNMAVSFSELILWWVRTINEIEIAGNSLERISNYIEIDQEPAPTAAGRPPAYWPSSGSLHVENLSARYSKDGPLVLNNLSFDIKSGERIAIVGRTGSGKSSLALSLLRMIPTTGIVYFDGRPTHEVNLDDLRANLTIIPQDPLLISGTLRTNLDPFSLYDDAVLNDALRASGLFRLQHDDDEDRIALDTLVSSGGSNFSVGQRQIIALARAIVRGAKVLILDEATASVDVETDNVIQASIREQMKHSTLITIAHRLQTIADYDKVIVLDGGKLMEIDSPIALLEKGGFFCNLVEQSGDRENLWEMARKTRLSTII